MYENEKGTTNGLLQVELPAPHAPLRMYLIISWFRGTRNYYGHGSSMRCDDAGVRCRWLLDGVLALR